MKSCTGGLYAILSRSSQTCQGGLNFRVVVNRNELIRTVRDETDPVRRVRLAGEAMTQLQQGEVELSRLRREAIEDAASAGLSYSEIARQVDLTRGRVSQIRSDSPPAERAFFGVGPLTLAVPLRPIQGRDQPVVASEDMQARNDLAELLNSLVFHVYPDEIDPRKRWRPAGDELIAICGPKSSPTIAELLSTDPLLNFSEDSEGRWGITDRITEKRFESPMDDDPQQNGDVAYVGRLNLDKKRQLLLIAGVHAIGSVGAVHYLQGNVKRLYDKVGNENFSMVVASTNDGSDITASEESCPPEIH